MNEHQLRRLLQRMLVLSAPLPLAILSAACGGTELMDDAAGGTSTSGGQGAGGSGIAGNSGGGGTAGKAGGGGSGGATAGAGGWGSAGAGGGANGCRPGTPMFCGGGPITIPKACIDAAQAVVSTALPLATCDDLCSGGIVLSCSVTAVDTSSVTVQCATGCATGRRPAGLTGVAALGLNGVGDYFAEVARLEAASIAAFRIMRDELRAHGAPKRLVRAAARAARDEVRHTRATGALARRFGQRPRSATVARGLPRSIEAMALENAVEGCVRETFGALLASRQARSASDPVVRAAMTRIARDETRHAALSWRVGRWLETRLAPEERHHVEHARRAAARELLSSIERDPALGFAGAVGLPSPAEATALALAMQRALWS